MVFGSGRGVDGFSPLRPSPSTNSSDQKEIIRKKNAYARVELRLGSTARSSPEEWREKQEKAEADTLTCSHGQETLRQCTGQSTSYDLHLTPLLH